MWICLGCALAARQWERVWQRAAHGGPVPGQKVARQQTVTWPRPRPGELGAPDRPGNDDSVQKRRRFWTELREGQREAEKHRARLSSPS
jgi:hypothetical protein